MKYPPSRPWLLAALTLGLALVPVWLGWLRFRDEARRKDAQLFEATSGLAGERIQLALVRHLNFFNILRNQLRMQPSSVRDSLRMPPNFRQSFPHLLGFGYAAADGNRAILQWTDGSAGERVGDDLASDSRRATLLARTALGPTPSAVTDAADGGRIFVASTIADSGAVRGYAVGWLDINSLCRNSGVPLLKDGVLTVAPLGENGQPPDAARFFEIREGEFTLRLAIARGPAFGDTYRGVSPTLVLGAGGACALLLAFLVFQGARTLGLRAALEAERVRARLVQGFSHEFRTPLSVILSSADLLSAYFDKIEPARRDEALAQIHDSAGRMSAMVDEILLLSRLESGRVAPQPAEHDLDALCHAVAREVAAATRDRYPLSIEAAGTARCDATLLRGILANLLGNAVKYSPAGSAVRLAVEPRGSAFDFTVSDHGIGIPSADLPRIGEAFHRAANVGDTPGTGFGLAIVRRSAALLGGTFTITSVEGRGTTATLTLPAA